MGLLQVVLIMLVLMSVSLALKMSSEHELANDITQAKIHTRSSLPSGAKKNQQLVSSVREKCTQSKKDFQVTEESMVGCDRGRAEAGSRSKTV